MPAVTRARRTNEAISDLVYMLAEENVQRRIEGQLGCHEVDTVARFLCLHGCRHQAHALIVRHTRGEDDDRRQRHFRRLLPD